MKEMIMLCKDYKHYFSCGTIETVSLYVENGKIKVILATNAIFADNTSGQWASYAFGHNHVDEDWNKANKFFIGVVTNYVQHGQCNTQWFNLKNWKSYNEQD
jgi:hypothetical protein